LFSQNSKFIKNPKKENKLSIGIVGGNYIQVLELNGDHLANLNSYSANISLDYFVSENSYIKTGYQGISTISFAGISYDSYKLPLLFGHNFFSGKKFNSDISLQGEIGLYLRDITNFNNNSSNTYTDKSVIGIQFSFNLRYDLSKKWFAIISLNSDRDFNDIITSQDNTIKIKNSYALRLGFGLKF
jgi:hypothetical protein